MSAAKTGSKAKIRAVWPAGSVGVSPASFNNLKSRPDGGATVTAASSPPAGAPKVLEDLFDRGAVQINGSVIRLGSRARAEFTAKAAELGRHEPIPVPKSDRACERALEGYRNYEARLESSFRDLAEERSADAEIQQRIARELWKLYLASTRHGTDGKAR